MLVGLHSLIQMSEMTDMPVCKNNLTFLTAFGDGEGRHPVTVGRKFNCIVRKLTSHTPDDLHLVDMP